MFRAALIGCGQIGSTFADDPLVAGVYSHAGAYDACSSTTLASVCDVRNDAAEQCARRWGVPASYTRVDEMLIETAPEIVSVCTPDSTHAAMLDRILECPTVKGILAEKPLALHFADAERIVRTAHDRGVMLAVNYTRRYTAGHQQVHDAIRAGRLGRIQAVSGHYTKGILHNGTHWFDLARWLIGEVTSVQAFSADTGSGGPDPDIDVYLRFDNGARGSLLACRSDSFSIFEMDIVGTQGRVRLYDSGHRVEWCEVGDSVRYRGYRALARVDDRESDLRDSILHAVDDLVRSIESGTSPRCNGADAVAALRIATLAVRSAQAGQPLAAAVLI